MPLTASTTPSFTATAVTNGAEAVEAVQHDSFDLVLIDCQMPVMDGFEATRRIRNLHQGDRSDIPIIAVTADAMSDDRDRRLNEGMNDYLAKPVELGPLQNVVAEWLREFGAPDTVQSSEQVNGEYGCTKRAARNMKRRASPSWKHTWMSTSPPPASPGTRTGRSFAPRGARRERLTG